MTDRYKLWADECASLFGEMDIIAVDAVHSVEGKEFIIELNDTAIGLASHHEEDMEIIKELVLRRMEELFLSSQ